MAFTSSGLSVSTHIDFNHIPAYIEGMEFAAQQAVLDAAHQVVQDVEPYTPIKTGKLSSPTVRQYGDNSAYIQWLAKNRGYYYAPIQNATLYEHYTTHGGPGFMDMANAELPELVLQYMQRYMPS